MSNCLFALGWYISPMTNILIAVLGLSISLSFIDKCISLGLSISLSFIDKCISLGLSISLSFIDKCISLGLSISLSFIDKCISLGLSISLSFIDKCISTPVDSTIYWQYTFETSIFRPYLIYFHRQIQGIKSFRNVKQATHLVCRKS